MKIGITSVGAYVPYNRIRRETIAKAWERGAIKGERSIVNNDEDSLTMAVEAVGRCLQGMDRQSVDAAYVATTTAPYAEKSIAAMVATVSDLKPTVGTADFGSCLKGGTSALKAALDAVKAQSAVQALVAASDCRIGFPKSDQEQLFGDAAAAVLVGSEDVVAELECFATVNNEIIDVWRLAGERYVRTTEDRFIVDKGYTASMVTIVRDVLKKANLTAQDIRKVVLSSPGLKENSAVAQKTGFSEQQLQDSLVGQVGNCGTAQPLLALAAALEDAKAGDRILLAAYGNGADAFIFRVTDNIGRLTAAKGVRRFLDNKRTFESYVRYLSFRELVDTMPAEPFRLFPSNAGYWRDQKSILRFYGSQCSDCGTSAFPIQRVCSQCGSQDKYREIRLADRQGKVFTYSIDKLAGRSDDPIVVQTVVEDSDGTRYYLVMTDYEQAEVAIGLDVEFTFRKIYVGADYINYYWKCRPARMGGSLI